MTEDPYVLRGRTPHPFWAESVAEFVLDRDPEDPIVIKGGISPSGVPHLGNMNEITRGYFVAEALRDRGRTVRQLFTADDRDPLRKVPRALADLDGEVVGLDEVDAGALGRNLGRPYTAVPDPFGCCDSYGAHFSNLVETSADLLGIPVETVSTTELYESGDLEGVTRFLLEHRGRAREVLAEYQATVGESYVPFNPICADCGKVTGTVTAVDADAGTVDYECTDTEAGGRTIEGCGHEGTATLREGKLPWRFEWPAQWQALGVDHEPFGKDHAEGSWESGVDIARNVLDVEPPVPMVYEWFTLDGEPFSSSEGNVALVHDVLDLLEPEVLRYFFTKDPTRARDFDTDRLDQLVSEFDAAERTYYGAADGGERDPAVVAAAYPPTIRPTVAARFDEAGGPVESPERASVPATGERRAAVAALVDDAFGERERLPYPFAAVLGMTDDRDLRLRMAHDQGHLSEDAPGWVVDLAMARVPRARTWAERADNEYNYRLRADLPEVPVDDEVAAALEDLADVVAEGADGESLQGEIHETAKRHDLEAGELFGAGYELFLGKPEGPRLGPFLAALDPEFVAERLRREG